MQDILKETNHNTILPARNTGVLPKLSKSHLSPVLERNVPYHSMMAIAQIQITQARVSQHKYHLAYYPHANALYEKIQTLSS